MAALLLSIFYFINTLQAFPDCDWVEIDGYYSPLGVCLQSQEEAEHRVPSSMMIECNGHDLQYRFFPESSRCQTNVNSTSLVEPAHFSTFHCSNASKDTICSENEYLIYRQYLDCDVNMNSNAQFQGNISNTSQRIQSYKEYNPHRPYRDSTLLSNRCLPMESDKITESFQSITCTASSYAVNTYSGTFCVSHSN